MSYKAADPLPPERGPWCTMCGHVASFRLITLDPRRPIAQCLRGYPDHKGCGRVIASYDYREAEQAYSARRRRITEARHKQHDPERPERWANWCRPCDAVQAARSHTGTNTAGTKPAGAAGRMD